MQCKLKLATIAVYSSKDSFIISHLFTPLLYSICYQTGQIISNVEVFCMLGFLWWLNLTRGLRAWDTCWVVWRDVGGGLEVNVEMLNKADPYGSHWIELAGVLSPDGWSFLQSPWCSAVPQELQTKFALAVLEHTLMGTATLLANDSLLSVSLGNVTQRDSFSSL